MQNRCAGDIGDYVKFAILRALFPQTRVGIAWWLYPDESHNTDGRHIDYLQQPEKWRHLDPGLFDSLQVIVAQGLRDVAALERADFVPGATYAGRMIPIPALHAERSAARQEWFRQTLAALAHCDVVFADPDNGIEPSGYRPASAKAGKSIKLEEVSHLAAGDRCVVGYHHQTRRKGGHGEEISHWCGRVRDMGFARVDAIRARPYSARAFFIINGSDDIRQRTDGLARRWDGAISWHPDGRSPAHDHS